MRMKSKMFLTIIALVVSTLAACGDGTNGDSDDKGKGPNSDNDNSVPTITITGIPKIGEKIIATSTGNFLSEKFMWGYSYDGNIWFDLAMGVHGENFNEFTITDYKKVGGPDLAGKYIMAQKFSITATTIRSNILGPITE
jgi:hypothetical protein